MITEITIVIFCVVSFVSFIIGLRLWMLDRRVQAETDEWMEWEKLREHRDRLKMSLGNADHKHGDLVSKLIGKINQGKISLNPTARVVKYGDDVCYDIVNNCNSTSLGGISFFGDWGYVWIIDSREGGVSVSRELCNKIISSHKEYREKSTVPMVDVINSL